MIATYAAAEPMLAEILARALAPRKSLLVSLWADSERRLSSKGSAEPGAWRTARNPPLREPMDCFSVRSTTRQAVLKWPIQFGKTEIAITVVGYTMSHHPGPIMVCLPGEVSLHKWVVQKLNPMLDETPAVRATLASTDSRNGSNRREFKDFLGGQLYVEHAGSPQRLKSTSVRTLIVDELDEFAASLTSGDDPVEMLDGRTSAFPATYRRLYISTPQMQGSSRIDALWQKSDQRRYHVPCPHCGEFQPLEWAGLRWSAGAGTQREGVAYVCRECAALIDEHHKTAMIAAGRWVAENPGAATRGYHINCLYYPIGLGPRWVTLVEQWLEAQNDPAKLKTFVNDRLAETWEDPAMRAVKQNVIADRVENYALRTAPPGVLVITAGVDTQDNRLAVQIVGWGRGMSFWTLDYVELSGDPADHPVWAALTELLTTPIATASGALLRIEAVAIDAGGHRTEDVKAYVRRGHVADEDGETFRKWRTLRRMMVVFGAVPNNAPILSKGKMQEINWRGAYDKTGVMIFHVGTVAIKHLLYSRLSNDADKTPEHRAGHFSHDLPRDYFAGLVSETYNPTRNRFEKKRGARNEPLDTWVYAFAATHHRELRLHRYTHADWDRRATKMPALEHSPLPGAGALPDPPPVALPAPAKKPTAKPRPGGFANNW